MSGSISFNYLNPGTIRIPGVYVEDDSSGSVSTQIQNTLIVGQVLSNATITVNQPVLAVNQSNVNSITGGPASMLSAMYARALQQYPTGNFYVMAVQANGATASVQSITPTVTGTAGAGSIPLYVAGTKVSVPVAAGSNVAVIGNTISTYINTYSNLPATATANPATGVVTVTAKIAGYVAGDVDIRTSYLGPAAGETMPPNVNLTVSTVTAGATDPDLAAPLANVGSLPVSYLFNPYTNGTALSEVTTFFNQTTGRWSPTIAQEGVSFSAARLSLANAVALGQTINDQFQSILPFSGAPEPGYIWTAAYGATAANSLSQNPNVGLAGLNMGVLAPPLQFINSNANNESLLFDGMSTFKVVRNQTQIQRAISTYVTNPATGVPDFASWGDINTACQLAYVNQFFRSLLGTKYARCALVSDSTNVPTGSSFVTLSQIKAEVVGGYALLCDSGYCQNLSYFSSNVQVQDASQNGTGIVAIYLPVILSDPLQVFALNVTFTANS